MIDSLICMRKFGMPTPNNTCMILWDVPTELEIGLIPKKIWCNELLITPATIAFKNLIEADIVGTQLLTYDGCFNIRSSKGNVTKFSLHSWGLALDFNAFENQYGKRPRMQNEFVQCFIRAGFDWGGHWKTPDGMHFQLKNI